MPAVFGKRRQNHKACPKHIRGPCRERGKVWEAFGKVVCRDKRIVNSQFSTWFDDVAFWNKVAWVRVLCGIRTCTSIQQIMLAVRMCIQEPKAESQANLDPYCKLLQGHVAPRIHPKICNFSGLGPWFIFAFCRPYRQAWALTVGTEATALSSLALFSAYWFK